MATTATMQQTYDVGGVMLKQPFKIRRLGHFGFNVANMEKAVHFYRDLLGFRVSDILDFKQLPHMRDALQHVEDGRGYFFHRGHDHHTFVLFPKQVMDVFMAGGGGGGGGGEVTINQITWQTGSLAEVVHGAHFFRDRGIRIQRVGRDMPGSNWHVYPVDPDGHVNELYYGIEQIGWLGRSKPKEMYYRKFTEEPPIPQMSEEAEVEDAVQKGIDIYSGFRDEPNLPAKYDVEGVMLPRPFAITKIGPINLFVKDLEAALDFYVNSLGFKVTEEGQYRAHRLVFLRHGAEHHSLALFPKALREELGCSPHTTSASFGIEVGSYSQLRNAVAFLKAHGVTFKELPEELRPGIDYVAYVQDPDGHLVQLYYYMEQLGWDGKARPKEQRRQVRKDWPETLEPLSDTYMDQVYQGPLG
jgi:catechol 2,3-dioxygenase-like lactoylglutathione lyase family enzyme